MPNITKSVVDRSKLNQQLQLPYQLRLDDLLRVAVDAYE